MKMAWGILDAASAKWKGEDFPEGITQEAPSFTKSMPVPMKSKYWDEVTTTIMSRGLTGPVQGLCAAMSHEQGAEVDEHRRVKHPVVIPVP